VRGLTKKVKNITGSTITKGSAVTIDSRGYITKITSDSQNKLFFGILLEDIVTGSTGFCVYDGYIPSIINISPISKGNMYTLSNGSWVATTDYTSAMLICSDVVSGVAIFLKFIKR
jgi:hypothetical protein